MGGFDDDIPIPDIPVYVFVIIVCVAALIAASQLLGLWLTGFNKPTPSEPVYIRNLHDKQSPWTLASTGEVPLRVPPAVATRVFREVRKSKSLEVIKKPEDIEEGKETEEANKTEEAIKEIERTEKTEEANEFAEIKGTEETKEQLEV